MINQRIVNVLAPLASRAYQNRYILDGTASHYVLINDLLEDVFSLSNLIRQQPNNFSALSQNELMTIAQTLDFIKDSAAALPEESANESLIWQDPVWQNIRNQASFCLSQLGINLKLWEQDNL